MSTKFPRNEKLKQKKPIEYLFSKGKWRTCDQLRIITVDLSQKQNLDFEITGHRFGVSVSKKLFKRAVDRNRIKRLLREVYRLNKAEVVEAFGANSLSMLFWISPKHPEDFAKLTDNLKKLCKKK